MTTSQFVVLTALLLVSGCAHAPREQSADLVIQNVEVVDTRTGEIARDRIVAITDGKIVSIGSARVQGAVTIDGRGRYLTPGFIDSHIHATEDEQGRTAFPLLIANGVTTIREENPSPGVRQIADQVRRDVETGRRIAPDIVFQGGEQHLTLGQNTLDQVNAGKPSIDHLGAGMGLILDCSSDSDAIRRDYIDRGYKMKLPPSAEFLINPRAFDGEKDAPFYQRIIDTYSDEKCLALIQAFVRNSTWQTVTLIRMRTQDFADDAEYTQSENLKYVRPQELEAWKSVAKRFSTLPPEAVTTLRRYYDLQLHVTKLMSDNGVRILAGSDGGNWSIPGFSLHNEFRELSRAGLTPLQVLQATTLAPAEFLGREAQTGTVDVGKDADLVLLDGNPVADVANLGRISGVILNGRYLSKADLDALKSGVEAH
ncbi:MAG: amidohydrolase family protein [Hyphomonadaceae bacterium]